MTWILGWLNRPDVTQIVVMASADPLNVLLNYGGLGLGILLFVTGQLHSKGELQDVKEQRDKAVARLEELTRQMMGQTVPTLSGNLDVLTAIKDAVDAQVRSQQPTEAELLRDVLAELRKGQGT